jgi:amino acid transporter
MFFTIFVNGTLGIAAFIAVLFSIGDIQAALDSPTGYPFIEIFFSATHSRAGATAMASVLIVLIICATFGYVASASRQLWAFARDRGVPFSKQISHVRSLILSNFSCNLLSRKRE